MISLVCCNGRPPSKSLLEKAASTAGLIIAADGGAHILLESGINPDIITGDMDSFSTSTDFIPEGIELIPNADQETNDLEKALKMAAVRGADEVMILGGTGFRLDHTLKNLSVMQQFDNRFSRLLLIDDHCITRLIPHQFRVRLTPGTPVSLFPLSGRVEGITTIGLRYALNNEPLENGLRDGSSNEATQTEIEITYRSGALLLMIPTTWPLPY